MNAPEPTPEQLTALEKLRTEFLGANSPAEILRGFEIVKYDGREWEVVSHFRPTELAARQAAADFKWLQDRHPYDLYELRAVVSVHRKKEAPPTEQPKEG